MADGAAYDPAKDRWHPIASAPAHVLGGGGEASAWTGRLAVFWAGNAPDGPARGAAYRPATDRWRRFPAGPLGPREGYRSFWTGDELVILGGSQGDAVASPVGAALDPRAGTWRWLPGLRALSGLLPTGVVWTGSLAYIGGTRYADDGASGPVFAAYDPVTDTVTEIPIASEDVASFTPVGWNGTVVGSGDDGTELVAYDPGADTWTTLAEAPRPAADGVYPQSAWIDDGYVVAQGSRYVQVYDADADTWRRIDVGPSPFNAFSSSHIVWMGRLFVWSGVADRPGNPTPNVGATLRPS